jgi:outer membrane protein assembly factor BamD (BamD/ComL family)
MGRQSSVQHRRFLLQCRNFDAAIEAYQKVLDEYPRSQYIIEAIDGIQFAQLSAGG